MSLASATQSESCAGVLTVCVCHVSRCVVHSLVWIIVEMVVMTCALRFPCCRLRDLIRAMAAVGDRKHASQAAALLRKYEPVLVSNDSQPGKRKSRRRRRLVRRKSSRSASRRSGRSVGNRTPRSRRSRSRSRSKPRNGTHDPWNVTSDLDVSPRLWGGRGYNAKQFEPDVDTIVDRVVRAPPFDGSSVATGTTAPSQQQTGSRGDARSRGSGHTRDVLEEYTSGDDLASESSRSTRRVRGVVAVHLLCCGLQHGDDCKWITNACVVVVVVQSARRSAQPEDPMVATSDYSLGVSIAVDAFITL